MKMKPECEIMTSTEKVKSENESTESKINNKYLEFVML